METLFLSSLKMIISTVLPQVVVGSLLSLVVGIPIGGTIGHLFGAIFRRRDVTVIPAILGSSLGVLIIVILPILSQPSMMDGGAYSAILMRIVLLILLPLGSIGGGIVGSIFGLIFANRLRPRAGWASFLAIYVILIAGFYLKDLPAPSLATLDELPLVSTIPNDQPFFCCMAFSSDGQWLATANSGDVRIWKTESSQLIKSFMGTPRLQMNLEEEDIKAIAITPNNTTLAIAAAQSIKIIDIETGKLLHKLNGSHDVQFTPDSRTLLGIAETNSGSGVSLQMWDVTSGKVRHTIPLERSGDLAFPIFDIAADGKTLVMAPDYNNRIEVWDLTNATLLQTWGGDQEQRIITLALTPDGKTAILSQEDTLKFVDLSNGQITQTLSEAYNVMNLMMDPSSEKLIGYGTYVTLWPLNRSNRPKQWKAGGFLGISNQPVQLSPDGELLATYTIQPYSL